MKIAFISDIHGNLEALKATLEDIEKRKVDKIICLGDIIAKGIHSKECLDLIIKSLSDYKELISTIIKKSSENVQFDSLCGEVHVCNKLIKTFSAANGIEIVTIDKDTEIINEA